MVVASIKKVLTTLAEAVVLVFLVMLLFLQNIRYTLIPTIVVPVALLGTCAMLLLLGFSINVLTLFGMVLAIGILVDDAIVVVENVERIMSEEGLSPQRGHAQGDGADHRRHHRHHAGADVGVRADGVLSGLGRHHLPAVLRLHDRRDRLLVAAGAVAHAGLVRDHSQAGRGRPSSRARGVFGWFNRRHGEAKDGYAAWVRWSILRAGRLMLIYAVMLVAVGFRLHRACRAVFCRSTTRASSPPTC